MPPKAPRMPLEGPTRDVAFGSKGDGLVQMTCTACLYKTLAQSADNSNDCYYSAFTVGDQHVVLRTFCRIIVNRRGPTRRVVWGPGSDAPGYPVGPNHGGLHGMV